MSPILLAIAVGAVMQEPAPAPASSPPPARRIEGEFKAPKRLKQVAPEYPDDAVRAGLLGAVVLECVIDTEGRVSETRLVSGVPPLSDAAIKAVKKWRYAPTLLNGSAVPVIMTLTVNFRKPHDFRLQVQDLLASLKHQNEFIREAAASWLGTARIGPSFSPGDIAGIARELRRLEGDESERVRVAASRALARLEVK